MGDEDEDEAYADQELLMRLDAGIEPTHTSPNENPDAEPAATDA